MLRHNAIEAWQTMRQKSLEALVPACQVKCNSLG
jgi:hypothetical protein